VLRQLLARPMDCLRMLTLSLSRSSTRTGLVHLLVSSRVSNGSPTMPFPTPSLPCLLEAVSQPRSIPQWPVLSPLVSPLQSLLETLVPTSQGILPLPRLLLSLSVPSIRLMFVLHSPTTAIFSMFGDLASILSVHGLASPMLPIPLVVPAWVSRLQP
jgi:hypothetical protein